MKKLIIIAALLGATLTGCGVNGRSINGDWFNAPAGQVWCEGGSDGGIDCNWDAYNKAHP